jgi:YD repeat-containing protein
MVIISSITHDAADNRTRVDHPDGTSDTFTWDARGQVTTATVGGNLVNHDLPAPRSRPPHAYPTRVIISRRLFRRSAPNARPPADGGWHVNIVYLSMWQQD